MKQRGKGKHRKDTGGSLVRVHQGAAHARVAVDPIQISMVDKTIRVNLGLLPAPDRVYDADAFSIKRMPGYVAFYFGQFEEGDQERLRSRLKLKYVAEAFVHHFWKHSREFHKGLREYIEKQPPDPLRPTPRDISTLPAAREGSEWVSFDYMSRSGSQASLDFYHLPASGLAKFIQGQGSAELKLSGIARVLTTVDVLYDLLEACAPVVEQVKPLLPPVLEEDRPESADKAQEA